MKIIELINVSKSYKSPVLTDLNYIFLGSKTYLIVGENGSGKTTLIKLILGLINPTTGRLNKTTNNISYIPDYLHFPEYLKINMFLYNLGLIYNLDQSILKEKINYFLDAWSLDGNYKIKELSKGMKQKVLIIQALLKDGDIFIFDEPLNGLDVDIQGLFFLELKKLRNKKKTIILITHNVNEYNGLYDYKLRIINGRLNEEFN